MADDCSVGYECSRHASECLGDATADGRVMAFVRWPRERANPEPNLVCGDGRVRFADQTRSPVPPAWPYRRWRVRDLSPRVWSTDVEDEWV